MEFMKKEKKWKHIIKRFILQHMPIIDWIRNYSKNSAVCDIIAGITISLTMIPQSIAYAALADLPPQYGLNSAFMGCFIYVFFGTIREVVIGPTSLMALLTYEYTKKLNVDFVILLCCLCGIVELTMALLRLGFIVEFISSPVVSGFTTATSIIIIVSQIKGLFGIRFTSSGFFDNVKKVVVNLNKFQISDLMLGVACLIILALLKKVADINLPKKLPQRKIIKKSLWFLAIGRNAITILIACCISLYYENSAAEPPFLVTRDVKSGLPSFQLPPVASQIGNTTYTFPEMVKELGSGIIVIPIVSVLANVAIAKSFKTGVVDATQEMLALSFCNILGSCVQSMPTCGAFTRSAVISASGVRTPLAGLYSAGLTLLAFKFLAPFFHLIPRATLSAILISAVLVLIDVKIFLPLWKSSKLDLFTLLLTLLSCLWFGVEIGLLIGIFFGLGYLIYLWARPEICVEIHRVDNGTYIEVIPKLGIYFAGVDYVCNQIMRVGLEEGQGKFPIVVNCTCSIGSDYTTAKNFQGLNKAFEAHGQQLVFIGIPPTVVNLWQNTNSKQLNCCSQENLEHYLFGDVEFKKDITISFDEEHKNESQTLMGSENDRKEFQ